jgi:hypothetical protein
MERQPDPMAILPVVLAELPWFRAGIAFPSSALCARAPPIRQPTLWMVRRLQSEGADRREHLLVDVTPAPILARLEAADHCMLRLVKVTRRVRVGGIVAAPDMAALEAQAQVNPFATTRQTLLTAGRRSWLDRFDLSKV